MQYEIVFKVIGGVHVILAFLVLLLLLLKLVRRSSDGSPSTHEHMAKSKAHNKHTSKHYQKLRNSTSIHKNSTLN